MTDERIVFLMEQQPGSVRVMATGEVTHDMLDALMGFVHRARKRKDNFQEAAPSIDCPPHAEIRKSEGDTRYWVECQKCGATLRDLPIPNNA
jgi:hypothetical protein